MATINDGAFNVPVSLMITLPPTQAGSGTPSPDNVRALNGVSGITVYQAGEDTSDPAEYAVTFPDGAGTVYGGSLTINKDGSATLVSEYAYIKGGWVQYKTTSAGYKVYQNLGNPLGKYNNTGGGYAKSNTTDQFGSFNSDTAAVNKIQLPSSGTGNAYMCLDPNADPDDVEVVYVLNEAAVFNFTAVQLRTLLGVNNIWSSAGELEITSYLSNRRPYFIFRGKTSPEMGVTLDRYPPFSRAPQRSESVTVPGQQGDVTFLEYEEEPMYDPYVVTLDCFLEKSADPDAVAKWLSGAGALIIGNRPNRVMQVQIVNQIDFLELIRARRYASFPVPIKVQPLKSAFPAEEDIINTVAFDITNIGDVTARPLYSITAVADDTDVIMTVGDPATTGAALTVSLPEGVTTFIYDADARICMSEDGTVLLNSVTSISGNGAEGLHIPAGETVTITPTLGIASITVTPRWRYLV